MRLFMKQKVFSWNDKFTIKDDTERDRYYVEGEVFSLGHKLHVFTADGKGAAFIQQKIFSFKPRFFIYIGGRPEIELVREFTFLRQRYYIRNTDLVLEGDFSAHSYTLSSRGKVLMRVSKEWFSWGDSYVLDMADPADELLCLCIMIAVDCSNEDDSNNNSISIGI